MEGDAAARPNFGPGLQGPQGLPMAVAWPEVQEVPQLAPVPMPAWSSQTELPMWGEDWTRRRPPRAPRLATDSIYNAQPSISELHPAVYPFTRASTEGVSDLLELSFKVTRREMLNSMVPLFLSNLY